jgi:pimeloyl-ACP methyl ester carboxylesterase
MTQNNIKINGLQIAYLEVNPGGRESIFFIHGNSGSSRTWSKQLSDPLLKDYRLIAFDLPAHGISSASPDPEACYSLPALGKLVSEAVSDLAGGAPYILVGFSLGSNILAEVLNYPGRPQGLVLAGSSVAGGAYTMDKIFQDGVDATVFFSDDASEESIRTFAGNMSHAGDAGDRALILNDYKAVRPGFRPAFIRTVMDGRLSDEIALLQQAGLPVLVIFGREEKMARPDYLDNAPFPLWQDKVHLLPGAGHTVHADQPAAFNALLLEYAAFCVKRSFP